ncbi:hypothetical protein MZK47_09810 [Microbacterium aerolatum]|uniref:hypothetical protein n=1 Tax=Microbacterium aerolatum TaxID=153731 RepID=UPI0020014E80|nr:hypothetical protein [Microbacterium aerolatum]MCK3769962.1 hypothetical protein [Microbacterium aerolatum]
MVSALKQRGATLVALAVGAAPGFLLPVVLAVTMPLSASASFLLVFSLSQIVTGMIGAPYETTLLVRLGTLADVTKDSPRPRLWRLSLHAVTRLGLPSLASLAGFVAASVVLSPDLDPILLWVLAIPLAFSPIIRLITSALTAHLYVRGRLATVYFSTVFLGGPSILAALVMQDAVAVAISFAFGEFLRWSFLAWRVHVTSVEVSREPVAPPTWRELAPQATASLAGQGMPLLVQAVLTAVGAQAVTSGAIAIRIWGAFFQVGTSTIAMPETVRLVREYSSIPIARRAHVLGRRVMLLLAASSALSLVGVCCFLSMLGFVRDNSAPAMTEGLLWSVVLLIGLPFAMLHFWAGRGLIAVGASRWMLIAVLIGLVAGAITIAALVPWIGGIGTMIGQTVSFIAMATSTTLAFLQTATREGHSDASE